MIISSDYPTYVVFIAVFVAAAVTLVLMPFWIKLLRYRKIGQQIRADGPQRHLQKQGTPTMGGVVILVAILVTCVLLARWSLTLVLAVLATVLTALLGFLDDFESVAHRRSLGLTPHAKLIGQGVIVLIFTMLAVNLLGVSPVVTLPGGFGIDLGVLAPTFEVGGAQVSVPWLSIIFVWSRRAVRRLLRGHPGGHGHDGLHERRPPALGLCLCLCGCLHRLSVVQLLPGVDLHGGHRLPRPGDRLRRARRAH